MEMDELMSELLPIYIGELREHAKKVAAELLVLEKENDRGARSQMLVSILRTLHSLKGASRSVGLATTASVCHEMETILALGEEAFSLGANDYQILFKTFDTLEAMAQLLQIEDRNAERALAPLLFTLREHRSKLEKARGDLPAAVLVDEKLTEALAEPSPPKIVENSVRLPVTKLDSLLAEGLDLVTITNRTTACIDSINQLHLRVLAWQREVKQEGNENQEEAERLRQLKKQLEQIRSTLRNENRVLSTAVAQVAEGINSLRMVPIGQACQGVGRMVRDLSLNGGKRIQLEYSGMEIEVDRNVLEQIKDPLMHLVRNACDHGVESQEERTNAGKPATATIKIAAHLTGSQAQIAVSDDGRGINLETIRARAKKQSMPVPENESEMKGLIFTKGFSTASIITEVSGRGIGLDVVKDRVEGLHGSIELQTEPQKGSTFLINVPLTLTNMRVLFVRAGGQLFALGTSSIQTLLRLAPEQLKTMEGQTVLSMGDAILPVAGLSQILDLPPAAAKTNKILGVVLASADMRSVLVVEELLHEQEILVKDLGRRIKRLKYVSGSTILPDGKIALILNASELLRSTVNHPTQLADHTIAGKAARTRVRRLLLVDDSITTRSIEKHLLETAGFEVTACVDGAQAWQVMQEKAFDVVVSDVEMPNMDGFALTRKIKAAPKHMHIPVILVTALSSERHKALGISAGADAYLIKSDVDRSDLLEVINQLV